MTHPSSRVRVWLEVDRDGRLLDYPSYALATAFRTSPEALLEFARTAFALAHGNEQPTTQPEQPENNHNPEQHRVVSEEENNPTNNDPVLSTTQDLRGFEPPSGRFKHSRTMYKQTKQHEQEQEPVQPVVGNVHNPAETEEGLGETTDPLVLAVEVTATLGGDTSLAGIEKCCREQPHRLIREALARTLKIAPDSIRKSRGAIFTGIVRKLVAMNWIQTANP